MNDTASQEAVESPGVRAGVVSWMAQVFLTSRVALAAAGLTLLAAVCLLVSGIAADARFAIVGLMLVFLVFPMVVAMLFFVYGMRSINAINFIPHSVRETPSGLEIKVYAKRDGCEGNDEEPDRPEWAVSRTIVVGRERVGRKVTGFGGVWIEIHGEKGVEWLLEGNA